MKKILVNWGLKLCGAYLTGHWFGSVTGTAMIGGVEVGCKRSDLITMLISMVLIMYLFMYRVMNPAIDEVCDLLIDDDDEVYEAETETE